MSSILYFSEGGGASPVPMADASGEEFGPTDEAGEGEPEEDTNADRQNIVPVEGWEKSPLVALFSTGLNRVMTSPDGITWTFQTDTANNQ